MKPLIIDFHTHIFPPELAVKALKNLQTSGGIRVWTDATEAGLLKAIKEDGVDAAVILPVATKVTQVETINTNAIRQTAARAALSEGGLPKDGLIYFGAMHPEYRNVKSELKRLKAGGIKGIKIHPPQQHTPLNDISYLRIIDACAELDLICVTHAGWDISVKGQWCSPEMSREVVRKLHYPKLVLAHLGGVKEWDDVIEYICGEDVYLDTAMCFGKVVPIDDRPHDMGLDLIDIPTFDKIARLHGADRILFATDSPWNSHRMSIDELNKSSLDDINKRKIFGANAAKLLGLDLS